MANKRASMVQLSHALRRCEPELMKLDGVTGVAITGTAGGPAIAVYVKRDTKALRADIRRRCRGMPVSIEITGTLTAL